MTEKGEGIPLLSNYAELCRNLKENFDDMCKFFYIDAKLKRQKYNCLIEAGFTENQALELSKTLF